jgi:hypothetical protein
VPPARGYGDRRQGPALKRRAIVGGPSGTKFRQPPCDSAQGRLYGTRVMLNRRTPGVKNAGLFSKIPPGSRQAEHHRKRSFEDEFVAFLKEATMWIATQRTFGDGVEEKFQASLRDAVPFFDPYPALKRRAIFVRPADAWS